MRHHNTTPEPIDLVATLDWHKTSEETKPTPDHHDSFPPLSDEELPSNYDYAQAGWHGC